MNFILIFFHAAKKNVNRNNELVKNVGRTPAQGLRTQDWEAE